MPQIARILLLGFALASWSCAGAYRGDAGGGLAPVAIPSATPGTPPALLLFGGQDHKTFLGCLNCNRYSADSILNAYGSYGSAYSSTSIFNHFSDYGSAYSMFSACNSYATDPPVIVDSAGNFYGRLTLNQYHAQIGVGSQYHDFLEGVCH